MAKLTTPATADHAGWDTFLADRDEKKIGHNTIAHRVYDHATGREGIAIRLHHTDVVTFYSDGGIVLNSGGWQSVTTKDRMNAVLPASIRVSQKNYVWSVQLGGWETGENVPFSDGMVVRNGALVAS